MTKWEYCTLMEERIRGHMFHHIAYLQTPTGLKSKLNSSAWANADLDARYNQEASLIAQLGLDRWEMIGPGSFKRPIEE